MNTLNINIKKKYSYADYLTWIDDRRRELWDGLVKLMSPAPTRKHQAVSGNLYGIIWQYLRSKPCNIYHAPFDVRLPYGENKGDENIYTVVQPDISIICDQDKLDEKGCIGPPDMIIEIVSAQNSKRDVEEKFKLYEKHGIKEYWTVFPFEKTVNVYVLSDSGKYENIGMFAEDSDVKITVLENFTVNLSEVFQDIDLSKTD
jgi:Uma2 family endonuclease